MGFFANVWWTWIFPTLALVFLVVAAWMFSDARKYERTSSGKILGSIICLVLCVVCIGGYFFSATHTVVPVNKRALVINTASAQVVGGVRSPGLNSLPLWTGRVLIFNGGSDEQVCLDFTPSVQGGYEVAVKACFFINLGRVDWQNQYSRYATGYQGLLEVWKYDLSQYVAFGIKEYTPQQLTESRPEVINSIETNVRPWFESENIPMSRVNLANWDFTNETVAAEYDKTVIAQTQQIVAQAEFNAAETRRKTAEYVAETANLVLAARTTAMHQAMRDLGIESEDATVRYLFLQWLEEADPSHLRSIILNLGSGEIQATVPATE